MNGFLQPPQMIKMLPSVESQCRAIQELIRPWEVTHLFQPTSTWSLPSNYSATEAVAGWLHGQLSALELQYLKDPEGPFDYWCSPGLTLRRGGGDCEDLSILMASMLHVAEVKAYVVTGTLWNGIEEGGHAWVEGWDRFGGFLLEATTGQLVRTTYRPAMYKAGMLLSRGCCQAAA